MKNKFIREQRVQYGIDAPKVIRNLLVTGVALVLLSLFLPLWKIPEVMQAIKSTLFFPGIFLSLSGILMILYSRFGKFRQREKILNLHVWKGDEMVLDVGTGLGLLMIGAAKKLTVGKSYGIDIFNAYDLSGNTFRQLEINTKLENVSDRTVIVKENITGTSFSDNTFDVVVSNLCLHNIYSRDEREKACTEIFRVLVPGGVAIISDFKNTSEYKKVFKSLGMSVAHNGTSWFTSFPPLTIISAVKQQKD